MEPFRSVRGGGARVSLVAAEASLLRSLVGQVMSLVEPDDLEGPGPGPGPEPGEDAELAALEAMVHGPGADKPPEDPVLEFYGVIVPETGRGKAQRHAISLRRGKAGRVTCDNLGQPCFSRPTPGAS
jgi:hypothetical protein